jgi:hypothetical protein
MSSEKDSFVEYTTRDYDSKTLDKLIKTYQESKSNFNVMLECIMKNCKSKDLKIQYHVLLSSMIKFYYSFKTKSEYKEEAKRIEKILHAFHSLDCECGGVDYEPGELVPGSEKLIDLDADREKFKNILEAQIKTFEGLDLSCVLMFAKLIFKFNGYQAPLRDDVSLAIMDALGISDLFGELLNEEKKS